MQFYVLKPEPIAEYQFARTDALKTDGTFYGDAPRCQACGKFIGMRSWLPPYRIDLEVWGRQFADVVVTGTDLLVSERFKKAWEQSNLIGLSGFDVIEISRIKRHWKAIGAPNAYFRAVVHRSQTEIDFAASGFEWINKPTCPTCRLGDVVKRWERLAIDYSTWTGEDIFIARGLPGEIFVSERFKKFSDHNRITNVSLIPAENFGHDFYPLERNGVAKADAPGHEPY
jgi:hypothetical protein